MNRRVVIIGGGLAGLSCAVHARRRGAEVHLFEAAPQLGGRCRSYHDPYLGCVADNGSHLILGANPALLSLLTIVGGASGLVRGAARFPFVDLLSGRRWTLAPNRGPFPWWLARSNRRCPDAGLWAHLGLLALAFARSERTVSQWPASAPMRERLLIPLAKAILNAVPQEASARLLGTVLWRTLGRGGWACEPLFAPYGLSAAVIDPLAQWLADHHVTVSRGQRIRHLGRWSTVGSPRLDQGRLWTGPQDTVVFALPPEALAPFLPPTMPVPPLESRGITTVHYRLPPWPGGMPPPLLGVLGSAAEWIFCRPHADALVVSAVLSATAPPAPSLADDLWPDVAAALVLPRSWQPNAQRVLHHKRATLLQSPGGLAARDALLKRCAEEGMIVAGDWTERSLPATLEAAARAGRRAARQACEKARFS